VILGGQLVEPLPELEASRILAAESLARLPASLRALDSEESRPVALSYELSALVEHTRRNLR
jgi:hypothetical protein